MDIKAQKYKISINSTWLVLIDQKQRDKLDPKEYPVLMLLFAPDMAEIHRCIHRMWDNPNSLPVIICTKKPALVWEKLLKSLPLIYAAGGVIRGPGKRYLFIQRRGWWDLPKGKVDPGESNVKAALREVREEVGLTCTIIGKLQPTFHFYKIKKGLVLKKTFWFLMASDKRKPFLQEEEDITDYTWKSAKQLPAMKTMVYPNLGVLLDEIMKTG
ncbi:MAG: NUDIX domain-containing protein [Saprospiraceae bacterium]|nr:NUDIX domain-containing protein [Saprospiraceae bacterium]